MRSRRRAPSPGWWFRSWRSALLLAAFLGLVQVRRHDETARPAHRGDASAIAAREFGTRVAGGARRRVRRARRRAQRDVRAARPPVPRARRARADRLGDPVAGRHRPHRRRSSSVACTRSCRPTVPLLLLAEDGAPESFRAHAVTPDAAAWNRRTDRPRRSRSSSGSPARPTACASTRPRPERRLCRARRARASRACTCSRSCSSAGSPGCSCSVIAASIAPTRTSCSSSTTSATGLPSRSRPRRATGSCIGARTTIRSPSCRTACSSSTSSRVSSRAPSGRAARLARAVRRPRPVLAGQRHARPRRGRPAARPRRRSPARCVREADLVARLGGDEFTVVLPELRDGADARRSPST